MSDTIIMKTTSRVLDVLNNIKPLPRTLPDTKILFRFKFRQHTTFPYFLKPSDWSKPIVPSTLLNKGYPAVTNFMRCPLQYFL